MLRNDTLYSYLAAEILQGKTILEALNTDLVCDAIQYSYERVILTDRLRSYTVCIL